MARFSYCTKSGLKRGTWTPEEDRKLLAYITRYGHWNWREIPKFAGLSRSGKSCRLRWMNYLRPNIRRGNYTGEQEELIICLHHKLGNRWSAIAAKLPRRTDNEIKNHWHTNLKKQISRNSTPRKEMKMEAFNVSVSEKEVERTTSVVDSLRPTIFESSNLLWVQQEKAITDVSSSGDSKTETSNSYLIVGNRLETLEEFTERFLSESFQVVDSSSKDSSTSGTKTGTTESMMRDQDTEEIFEELDGMFWTNPFQVEGSINVSSYGDTQSETNENQGNILEALAEMFLCEPFQVVDSSFDDSYTPVTKSGSSDSLRMDHQEIEEIFEDFKGKFWNELFQIADSYVAENLNSCLPDPEHVFLQSLSFI